MLGLAKLALRGRSQAAMVATVLAMLALLMPLLSILSSAVVALVTLRRGWLDGLMVGGISAVASGLLAYLLLGTPLPVVGFLLVLWLPVWLLAMLLRASRSLSLVAQAALGFGLLLLMIMHLQMGQPQVLWTQLLQPLADGFVESQVMDAAQSQAFIGAVAAWMSGIFAAGFYFQLVLALLWSRSWQAQLFNPGGFRQEFHELRINRVMGWVALPLMGVTLLQGAQAPEWIRDLGVLIAPLLFLQGLAVIHCVVARTTMSVAWLVALYVLLFVAMPHAAIMVALQGLLDVFVDIRARLKPKPTTPEQ
jgi:hypothetical protein